MRRRVPAVVKVILVVNVLAILGFAFLLFVQPIFTELDVGMNYTQLDRAGVINADALAAFHPGYGFSAANHRHSVPRYVAGPALRAQQATAGIGFAIACLNLVVSAAAAWVARRGPAVTEAVPC